jgi:anti-sigma B factor antagonist
MVTLNISERQAGDVLVLDLNGDVTFGEGNAALRNAIRRIIDSDKTKILLNFENVCYFDSSGIGELVSGFIAINRVSGQLKLLNLSPRHKEVLSITKLLTVFEIFDNEEKALSSFNDF